MYGANKQHREVAIMANPQHNSFRPGDPFSLHAEYRLDNLMQEDDRAEMRRAARAAVESPLIRFFGDVACAGFVEGTFGAWRPGRETARQADHPAEEWPRPLLWQRTGGLGIYCGV